MPSLPLRRSGVLQFRGVTEYIPDEKDRDHIITEIVNEVNLVRQNPHASPLAMRAVRPQQGPQFFRGALQ